MLTTTAALFLLACPCPTEPGGFAGGSGTVADPYLICERAQLELVRDDLDASYRLVADIDLTGAPWTPIADGTFTNDSQLFNGIFDGGGFTVANMTAGGPGAEVIGFFGRIGLAGAVRNLRVENATVQSNLCGGVLAAENRGRIERCSVSGTVTGGTYLGGFIGDNQSIITDSYSEASASANSYVGGFSGVTFVNQSGVPVLRRCHSVGAVSGNLSGGFVGRYLGAANSYDCFWNVETSGQATSAGGTGVTSGAMATPSTFDPPWNFAEVWTLAARDMPRHQLDGVEDCPGDLDAGGSVGFSDLNVLLAEWGPCRGCVSDLDGNGSVGFTDLNVLLAAWGPCP